MRAGVPASEAQARQRDGFEFRFALDDPIPNLLRDREFSFFAIAWVGPERLELTDLPALTGPGSELVYAASWFMGNPSPGTMISGAGGR
jgi:hypothetical protein